jgi:excisionase family DNA binding protein
MSALLSTGQVAQLLHVSPATVKRWAAAGILTFECTAGGHRRFAPGKIDRLLRNPDLGTELGVDRWIELLLRPGPALSVDAALLAERSRVQGWFEVAELLGPVLEALGRRWERGELTILEEHVASERLSRALDRAAASLPMRAGSPRAVLATPEDEAHTLGLSLAELCMREWGWATIWAGRATPLSDLERLAADAGVEAVALSASVCSEPRTLEAAAQRLGKACRLGRVGLVMGGRGAWQDPPPFGSVERSFRGLRAWMARLESGHLR